MSKSSASIALLDKVSDVSRTYVVEGKHGLKRLSEDSTNDNKSKKTDVQKFLFSNSDRTGGKPADRNKFETKDSGFGKGRQHPTDLQIPARPETFDAVQKDKKLSPTPKFDARAFEKHSVDFLSLEKEVKDVKSPKRQLPLIFQGVDNTGDTAADKSKTGSDGKTSFLSKDKGDSCSQPSSLLPGNRVESKSAPQVHGNKLDSHSNSSALTGSKADGSSESASDTKFSQKTTGPVAKPRHVATGTKVFEEKMDVSEPVQLRAQPAAVPRPAPRSCLSSIESSHKSELSKTGSPPVLRKVPARPKSPGRSLSPEPSSPPPLPSSAPPPLPLTAPAAHSPHPSPRHLPTSTAPPSHDTVIKSKSREALLPKKSPEPSCKSPRQQGASSGVSSALSSANKSPRPQGASSGVSSALLSSARKDHVVSSSSGHRDKLTPPSRPPPHISVSNPSFGSSSRPPPLVTITSSSKTSSPSSVGSSVSSNKHCEKPMDVDVAVSKARSQYGKEPVAVMVVPVDKDQQEKTTRTGLLQSLAHVRDTSSSTSTSTTITSASPHPPASFSNSADKTHNRFSVPTSESKGASSSGFVSSKVSRLQTKDADHNMAPVSASNVRGKSDTVSPRDVHITDVTGKSSLTSQKLGSVDAPSSSLSSDAKNRMSPRPHDASTSTNLPDMKLGETMTVTLNMGNKNHKEPSKPNTFNLSSLELKQNGKSTDHAPLFRKSQEESRSQGTCALSVDVAGQRDRANSATDVLNMKALSSSKQKATTPDALQPPAFMQVKLRDSSSSTVERKERSKSAGNVLENGSESKPEWQLEAKRRMAALRDVGFVDPETRKSPSGRESPVGDDVMMKQDRKKEPEEAAPFQTLISDFSPREEVSQAKLKEDAKRGGQEIVKAGQGSRSDVVSSANKSPTAAAANKEKDQPEKSKFNLNLKGILKSEDMMRDPPPKLERHDNKPQEHEIRPLPRKSKLPTACLPQHSPGDQEVGVTKKKIGVGSVGEAPPRPSSPPHMNRKKVSVDVNFDFNSSNSVEITPTVAEPPAVQKLPPPARPPPPRRTSVCTSFHLALIGLLVYACVHVCIHVSFGVPVIPYQKVTAQRIVLLVLEYSVQLHPTPSVSQSVSQSLDAVVPLPLWVFFGVRGLQS